MNISLLKRYSRLTSSLTLYHPLPNSNVKRLFNSTRTATLPPMALSDSPNEPEALVPDPKDSKSAKNNDKKDDKKGGKDGKGKKDDKKQKENEPIADYDVPAAGGGQARRPDLDLKPAPPLPAPTASNFTEILRQKIDIVKTECDFFCATADLNAKDVKTNTLTELLDLVQNGVFESMRQEDQDLIFEGIESGLFRYLKPVAPTMMFSDDLVPMTECAWPHVTLCYQILTAIIEKIPDHKHFNEAYVKKLLGRFVSCDATERNTLANVVILLKDKRPEFKSLIFKKCCNIVVDYLDKEKPPYHVAPALTVMQSVFKEKPPTDQEPTYFEEYKLYVLPALGAPHYTSFHQQMKEILELFVKGAPSVAALVTVKALMAHFPKTRSIKTVNFLHLLTMALTKITRRDFKDLMKPVFLLFADCSASCQVKVSEASVHLWNKIELEPMIMDNARYIFPLVYGILSQASKEIWSQDIVNAIDEIFQDMNRIDSFVFQELCRSKNQKGANAAAPAAAGEDVKKWANVARAAARRDRDVNLASKLAEIQRVFTGARPTTAAAAGGKR